MNLLHALLRGPLQWLALLLAAASTGPAWAQVAAAEVMARDMREEIVRIPVTVKDQIGRAHV